MDFEHVILSTKADRAWPYSNHRHLRDKELFLNDEVSQYHFFLITGATFVVENITEEYCNCNVPCPELNQT